MSNITSNALPVIAGVEITTDDEGRFNLNMLHRASGAGDDKSPGQWLRRKTTKELIEELDANLLKNNQDVNLHLDQRSINSVHGGTTPGTFAHELLAIEYAGWISPAFRLQVNQTFLDYKTGKLKPAFDPMEILGDPRFLRSTLLGYSEKLIALENQVEEMKPEVEAYERLAKSDGAMCITDAAKHLQGKPSDLFRLLSEKRWIYRRAGGKSWLAYQDKIQSGLLLHKVTQVTKSDGTEKIIEQVLVTAKGLTRLSKMIGMDEAA